MTTNKPTDEEKIAALDRFSESYSLFEGTWRVYPSVPESPQVRKARKNLRDAAGEVLRLLLGRKPKKAELDRIVPLVRKRPKTH
jgi:hypothetical protein